MFNRRRLSACLTGSALLAGLLLAGLLVTGWSQPAAAQGAIMRNQTRIINQAVTNQVRQALRPRLLVRDGAGAVSAMETGAAGRHLALASADGGVRVWDLESGRQVQRLQAGPVRALAVADASRTLATVGPDGSVTLWDILQGQPLRRIAAGGVQAVRLSPDGALLATAAADGTVRLWSAGSGQPAATLPGAGGAVAALAFSPDGRRLAAGGADRAVRLWSIPDGQPLATMTGADAAVTALAFAADGTLHAGDAGGAVQVWRAGSTTPARSIRAAGSAVTALAVRPDGLVAVANGSRSLGVWTGEGRQLVSVENPEGTVAAAAFAPGAERVIGAGSDGRARVWDLGSGALAAQLIMTRGGWSVLDGAGRFDGSDGGLGDVAWQAEQEVFEMTNFSQPYYEPGLLAKTLRAPAALLTPGAPTVTAGIAPPPTVQIAAPAGAAAPGPASVAVTAADRGAGIAEIVLYANGKALDPAAVTATEDVDVNGQPGRRVTFTVDLVAGTNRLRAVALGDNRIESVPAQALVTVVAPVEKPVLHVVVVGINQYANPVLELNYAVADARGVTAWARKQTGGGVFAEVKLHELYDRQATRANIGSLFAQLKATRPQDVVVIYVAGHGENAEQSWYFLPTEFGRNLPFETAAGDARGGQAFRQAVLQAVAADGISARSFYRNVLQIGAQHVVLLIDSCKSGGVRRAFEADADRRALALVGQQAGVHILAATDKNQLAVELEALGHGAFTYAVLNGLGGAADGNPADGMVSAREVLGYAVAQVPAMALRHSQSEQNPTAFSRGADFTLGPAGERQAKARKKKS
ncbi:caspase family protein [Azospirillum sp. HJ39]|uniref:caspase family protein n=1 Tax=Azospirillum sp. HJ39 TaxID=3159496 RepID=UPI00355771C0